jgi:bifunctional enzyme CysN/CysC
LRGATASVDDLADQIEHYLNQRGLIHSLVDEGWSI